MSKYNIDEMIRVIESCQEMTEAARKLGITRTNLYYRLRKHGLRVVKDATLKVLVEAK